MSAQEGPPARTLKEESLFKKAKALVPIRVPLFISAFRRADELATAMACAATTAARWPYQTPCAEIPAAGLRCYVRAARYSGAGGAPAETGGLKREKYCNTQFCKRENALQ